MIEPEIAFADLNDDMDLIEDLLKYSFQYVLDNAPAEMEFFEKFINPEVKIRLENLVKANFARVSYTDAIDLLQKSKQKFEYPVKRGMDIQTEHERYLSETTFK